MRLQTDRKIEIVRLVKVDGALATYAEATDPNEPGHFAPAINEGKDFAPNFETRPGDLLLVKVLE